MLCHQSGVIDDEICATAAPKVISNPCVGSHHTDVVLLALESRSIPSTQPISYPLFAGACSPNTMMVEKDDYSFLFEPPKDSDVFTRTLYYPRSPSSPESSVQTTPPTTATSFATVHSSLGDNRYAATLSKFTAGVFSSSSAALETVAPFLNSHIPDQVHIPDNRGEREGDNDRNKQYCYRHQPDLRCQRRTPQEDTMAEIQKVPPPQNRKLMVDNGCITLGRQTSYQSYLVIILGCTTLPQKTNPPRNPIPMLFPSTQFHFLPTQLPNPNRLHRGLALRNLLQNTLLSRRNKSMQSSPSIPQMARNGRRRHCMDENMSTTH